MSKLSDEEEKAYEKMSPEERHAFRVKKRGESQAGEKEPAKVVVSSQKKGILERVADKAERARSKYDYVGAQVGRIGKAISPTKSKQAKPPRVSHVKVIRQPAQRRSRRRPAYYQPRVQYVPAPSRPSYDPFNDLIHGTGAGTARRTSEHINDLTGQSRGPSSDFFNDIMGNTGKKKGKGRDPFKDLLG
jgi:hypothetical protein